MFLVFSKEVLIICLKEGDEIKYFDKEITVKKRKTDGGVEYYFDDSSRSDYCIDIYDTGKSYALVYNDNKRTSISFVKKKFLKDILIFRLLDWAKNYKIKVDAEKLKDFLIDCVNAWNEMFSVSERNIKEIAGGILAETPVNETIRKD